MKILIVGSKSIHASSFIDNLFIKEDNLFLLSEDLCDFLNVKSEKKISFRSLNPYIIIRNYFKLKFFLKELNPEIIHIHQLNRFAFFVSRAASKLKIPIVSTAWGSDVLVVPDKNIFYRFLILKTIERSTIVTADAKIMIDKMQLLVRSSSKYQLLQYGIEMVDSIEKENIIFSNRLHRELYRIDIIIEYFSGFLILNPNWKLVIGGEGDLTEKLKKKVDELGIRDNVEFVGWLKSNENKKWYAKSRIYISIPSSDGTSVSVLEAMSAGCIPILSDIQVSHEWIQNNENGIIEVFNDNPLLNALKIDEKKSSIINKKLVFENASRDVCTKRFIELYNIAKN